MIITAEQIQGCVSHSALVDKLQQAFASEIHTPKRQHFDIQNPLCERETTLLVMPSWQVGKDIGVKLVTVVPEADKFNLPSIQGTYVLIDAVKGGVKAVLDAPSLTAKRTAAASALASRFLSSLSASTLLMVGTGTLAPELIKAHCSVRNINKVIIWGRNRDKAEAVKAKVRKPSETTGNGDVADLVVETASNLKAAVAQADIISCATMSMEPLIKGDWLRPGQHLDMVGAYRPDMRETDDTAVQKCRLFVDNKQTAIVETGDLAIPIRQGVISEQDIEADLFALCKGQVNFSRSPRDITLFKSVGHALEDLAAAQLVMEHIDVQQ